MGETVPDLAGDLRRGLEFVDWSRRVPRNALVAIKPNLCWPQPLPGVTTSLPVLEALFGILQERTQRIVLVESNGGNFSTEDAFVNHGLPSICAAHNVRFANLSRGASVPIEERIAGKRVKVELSRLLVEQAEVFITVPVLKTHVVTTVSLGLKNQWGCIPTSMRLLYHHELDRGIVALNKARSPDLCIIDATYGLDGRGPLYGNPIPLGKLIISNNVVAADAVGAHLLGFNPRRIRHIRFAAQEGLGPLDPANMLLLSPIPVPSHRFHIRRHLFDVAAIITYKNAYLSRLVYDSFVTPLIYRLLRRSPPGIEESRAAFTDLMAE